MNGHWIRNLLLCGLLTGNFCAAAQADEAGEAFDITGFAVEGNTLLPAGRVSELVAPYIGRQRSYGDIQRALEAIENAYRAAGYSTVNVHLPEQELTQGVVRLTVTESVLGKIRISGNRHFSEANIRASLPALQEGLAPNARRLSENIQLANDNPAKKVAVTLGMNAGKVDAGVAVSEEPPQQVIASINNTGTAATGRLRMSLAYQHANLFDRDQTLTVAYTGSPDAPGNVKVNIYSLAWRLPLYTLGDSIDFLYGNSSVNAPSVQATGFGLAGKGEVAALRYNHYFPRAGEFSSRLTLGLEYKYFNTRCSINGVEQSVAPPTPALAACTPYTTRPLSLAYTGQWQGAAASADYSLGLASNLPTGSRYLFNGGFDRYSTIAGRPVSDNFTLLRASGSFISLLPADWQGRIAFSGQYSNHGLVSGEQFGMAGSTAVRGFGERAVTADVGHLLNLELYTPDFASHIGLPGSLRALAFYDLARGRNLAVVTPAAATAARLGIASGGVGARYNYQKNISLQADVANVQKAGPAGTEERGDWFGHMNLSVSF